MISWTALEGVNGDTGWSSAPQSMDDELYYVHGLGKARRTQWCWVGQDFLLGTSKGGREE